MTMTMDKSEDDNDHDDDYRVITIDASQVGDGNAARLLVLRIPNFLGHIAKSVWKPP